MFDEPANKQFLPQKEPRQIVGWGTPGVSEAPNNGMRLMHTRLCKREYPSRYKRCQSLRYLCEQERDIGPHFWLSGDAC